MEDEEIIKKLYVELCDASINKDEEILNKILSDDYILVHMIGKNQSKQEYINSVKSGELEYYESIHESIKIVINGDEATLIGKTKTLAAPFKIRKSWWNLRQDIQLKKENGLWVIKKSIASSY